MNRDNEVEFLIVGAGLAGCVLAMRLAQAGKRVLLIGESSNHCSRVAAGLFNPVTGKLLTKTWLAEDIFRELHQFYRQAEATTGQHFFYPTPVYRPFLSVEEQNEWMGKSASPEWSSFISRVHTKSANLGNVNDPLGGILLAQTGFLDVVTFMQSVQEHLLAANSFRSEVFAHEHLNMQETGVTYRQFKARIIVFCEGTDALTNPLFAWVPLRPLKGETLLVEADLPNDVIVNRGVYAVPRRDGAFKIGATYDTRTLTPGTTQAGRSELEAGFNQLFTGKYRIIGQDWGLRPTSPDRRPILGEHPVFKNVFIFNGLGTKGVSLAPFTSGLLTEYLATGMRLPAYAAVDVSRYYSLYWKAVQNP